MKQFIAGLIIGLLLGSAVMLYADPNPNFFDVEYIWNKVFNTSYNTIAVKGI